MPTTTNVSSNYEGKVAGAIIGASYKESDTLRRSLITMAPNVNFKLNMRKIAYTDGRVAYSCGFNPAGTVTLSERVLQPVKLKNDIEICKEDFRATWDEDGFGASASNVQLAKRIKDAIMAEVLAENAEAVEDMIWQGNNSINSNEWDGFETLFAADGDIIKPAPLGAALTEANVEAHLKTALGAIPVSLRRKGLVVGVSPDVYQVLWFYLVSRGIAWNGTTTPKRVGFGKYMVEEINGLSANKIAIYEKKNLVFGTGLQADHNRLAYKDMDELLLDGNVRMKIVFNGGCQYYNSEDIVYYNAIAVA